MHGQVGGSEPTSHGIRLFLGQRSQQTVRSRGQNHPARCQKASSSWLNLLTVRLFRRTYTSRTIPAQQSAACSVLAAPPWCCKASGWYLQAPWGLPSPPGGAATPGQGAEAAPPEQKCPQGGCGWDLVKMHKFNTSSPWAHNREGSAHCNC